MLEESEEGLDDITEIWKGLAYISNDIYFPIV